jgi:hypothetical protein
MQKNLLFGALVFLHLSIGCAPRQVNTLVSTDYNAAKNHTVHTVFPFGTATLPGKWSKKQYNNVSRQQFFTNSDSVEVAVAFTRFDEYEFNSKGQLKGFEFLRAFYEWDSNYFVEKIGVQRAVLEENIAQNLIIYRIFSPKKQQNIDTYFLIREKNGNFSNFSISITDKWTQSQKIAFLKAL